MSFVVISLFSNATLLVRTSYEQSIGTLPRMLVEADSLLRVSCMRGKWTLTARDPRQRGSLIERVRRGDRRDSERRFATSSKHACLID